MTGAFADALRNVLAENAVGLASRGRLARTRDAVKKHPDYSEHGYFLAVEMAFKQWEAMQNVGSPQKTSDRPSTAQADERAKPDSEKDAS